MFAYSMLHNVLSGSVCFWCFCTLQPFCSYVNMLRLFMYLMYHFMVLNEINWTELNCTISLYKIFNCNFWAILSWSEPIRHCLRCTGTTQTQLDSCIGLVECGDDKEVKNLASIVVYVVKGTFIEVCYMLN